MKTGEKCVARACIGERHQALPHPVHGRRHPEPNGRLDAALLERADAKIHVVFNVVWNPRLGMPPLPDRLRDLYERRSQVNECAKIRKLNSLVVVVPTS